MTAGSVVTATIARLNESRAIANAALDEARATIAADPGAAEVATLMALASCAELRVRVTDAQIRILEAALPTAPPSKAIPRH